MKSKMQSQILNGTRASIVARVVVALSLFAVATSAQPATPESPTPAPIYTLPPDQVKYSKGYPVIPPEIKAAAQAREKEWNRLDDEAWHDAEPEVARWAAKGRPYFALALNPDDLPQAQVPAFPGAEGGGMHTVGGRGGKVFVVTSLADSGPGTLREACEAGGPRIVVFNVAGIIHLERPIEIRAPYITIAGQTAPGDGVCVAGRSTEINTHDVVIRYMRFRRGITELADRNDALGGEPIGNVIIDHCSCSWGLDETLSIYRQMYSTVPGDRSKRLKLPTMNVTIQWTIISEALDTYHHAFGATWGGRDSLFAHNLFACNTGRNASIGMNYDFNWVNNVVFNWKHRTLDGGDNLSLINCINNYYKPGPATNEGSVRYRVLMPASNRPKDPDAPRSFGRYYVAGNVVENNERVTTNNWDGGVQFPKPGSETSEDTNLSPEQIQKLIQNVRLEDPLPMAPVTILTAQQAYQSVLADVGASLPHRDLVDLRIIEEVRSGKPTYEQGIITDINEVGGYPEYKGEPFKDIGADGIPLWWKKKYSLDEKDASLAAKDLQGDGYTVMDKYLNGLDPTKKIDWQDPKSNVNTLNAATFTSGSNAGE